MQTVPSSLRKWFTIHFVVDMLFAIPLFIAPSFVLSLFGFEGVVTARLVAAAFMAIGGSSLILNKKGFETYNTLLTLKIIWSITAVLGLILSFIQGAPLSIFLAIAIFTLFCSVWLYYKIRYFK